MRPLARFVATFVLIAAAAHALAEEELHVSFVPWKVVAPGEKLDAPLVLYWIPLTAEELRRSPLLTSAELLTFSARCIAMRIVRADDHARLESLAIDPGERPVVVLAGGAGAELERADAADVVAVERMVRRVLAARERLADERLDRADALSVSSPEQARALYRAVWEERCICPRQGRDAHRALKKLDAR